MKALVGAKGTGGAKLQASKHTTTRQKSNQHSESVTGAISLARGNGFARYEVVRFVVCGCCGDGRWG